MMLTAQVWKHDPSNKFWVVDCPALRITTQGLSMEDAREMLDDAIREVMPELEFHLVWLEEKRGKLGLEVKDPEQALLSVIKRTGGDRTRTVGDLTEQIRKGKAAIDLLEKILATYGKRLVLSAEDYD